MNRDWLNDGIWFGVSLLAPRGGVVVTRKERAYLRRNGTKVPGYDRWVFEGEWRNGLSDERFKCIAEGDVPGLGGRRSDTLTDIVNHCLMDGFKTVGEIQKSLRALTHESEAAARGEVPS